MIKALLWVHELSYMDMREAGLGWLEIALLLGMSREEVKQKAGL